MQFYVNQKLVNRRQQIGKYVSFLGLAILIGGMVITFRVKPHDPDYTKWMFVAMVTLLIGFISAQVGSYNLRRFSGGRRNMRLDESLASALKGFDERFEFYAWTLPAPYVLLSPAGLFVFSIRDEAGRVIIEGSQWRQPFSIMRLLHVFGQEGIGNPEREARANAEKMRRFIAKALPDLEVDLQPAVFFADKRVKLEQNNPTLPIIIGKDLKKFLRKQVQERALPELVRQPLSQLFRELVTVE